MASIEARRWRRPDAPPLYDPIHEKDACGTGFIAQVSGIPSHDIVRQAITAVTNLTHRGAVSADARTGDGAGILTQLPRKLLLRELADAQDISDVSGDDLAVGMVFFTPADPEGRETRRQDHRAGD